MDDIKDIERKGHISRIFSDKPIRTQAFGDNTAAERAYRRAERIAAAIHLVTNHISEAEPGRVSARQAAIELLSFGLDLRDEMRPSDSPSVKRMQICIRKLISLTHVLAATGRISLQNVSVLCAALDELGVFISASSKTPLSESIELTHEEFVGTGPLVITRPPLASKGQIARPAKDKSRVDGRTVSRVEKNHTRSESIIAVLKAEGTVGIKDIAAHLPEYSEKMIQRELKSLVRRGVVSKTGSKRWSMYSLAK